MAGETHLTLVGRLTADPELRTTPSGTSVLNFSLATNPRTFDKQAQQWTDGPASFHDCELWQAQAEHAAETLRKASRVIVVGTLHQVSYETRDGEQRKKWVVKVDEIGPSLRFVSARLSEPDSIRRSANGGSPPPIPTGVDPWAAPANSTPPF